MNLPAGRLRHRITLLALTVAQDPNTGDRTETYAPWAEDVPAEFTPLSSRDYIAAQASQSAVVARARIRYRDGVQSSMRLQFRGVTYTVEGPPLPDNESGLEYLTLNLSQAAP